jgi:hypothetical protein
MRLLAERHSGSLCLRPDAPATREMHPECPAHSAHRSTMPAVLSVGLHALPEPSERILCHWIVAEYDDARQLLDGPEIAVLVLGPEISSCKAHDLVKVVCTKPPHASSVLIVLIGHHDAAIEDECLNSGRLFYAVPETIESATLGPLIAAAVSRSMHPTQTRFVGGRDVPPSLWTFCERLTRQTDQTSVFGLLSEDVHAHLSADRVYVHRYDPVANSLHAVDEREITHAWSAAHGLVGWVAQTQLTVSLIQANADARYDREIDDPRGDGDVSFIAAPIPSFDGPPRGVIAVLRRSDHQPFSTPEVQLLSWLIACAASSLSLMKLREQVVDSAAAPPQAIKGLYRDEALDQYHSGDTRAGSLLAAEPLWLRYAHWLALAAIVLTFGFALIAKVDDLAAGPAIIRARHKVTLSAPAARTVRSVDVPVGGHVRPGDVLMRFYETLGDSLVDRMNNDVRATIDGVVSHIHAHTGVHVNPGEPLISIVDDRAGYEIVALLPGSYAPQVHRGMALLVTIDGYEDSRERAAIDEVSLDAIPAADAARSTGLDATGALLSGWSGPALVIRSPVSSSTYESHGRRYVYYDGMSAKAQVVVRGEPILFKLIPSVARLLSW